MSFHQRGGLGRAWASSLMFLAEKFIASAWLAKSGVTIAHECFAKTIHGVLILGKVTCDYHMEGFAKTIHRNHFSWHVV